MVGSYFLLLLKVLLHTFLYTSLGTNVQNILLSAYLGINYWVCYVQLYKTKTNCPPIYISTSHFQDIVSTHIISKSVIKLLYIYPPKSVKWYLILVTFYLLFDNFLSVFSTKIISSLQSGTLSSLFFYTHNLMVSGIQKCPMNDF